MNFAGNIAAFATGTYTVKRAPAPTTGTDGRAVPGTVTTLIIQASVQALNGRELQEFTEGARVAEARKLYTTTPLKVIDSPDIITIDGDDWQVDHVASMAVLGNYYKVLVTKVGN